MCVCVWILCSFPLLWLVRIAAYRFSFRFLDHIIFYHSTIPYFSTHSSSSQRVKVSKGRLDGWMGRPTLTTLKKGGNRPRRSPDWGNEGRQLRTQTAGRFWRFYSTQNVEIRYEMEIQTIFVRTWLVYIFLDYWAPRLCNRTITAHYVSSDGWPCFDPHLPDFTGFYKFYTHTTRIKFDRHQLTVDFV